MNSVLLLDPAHAVLVDPGVLPSELDDLAGAAGAERTSPSSSPTPTGTTCWAGRGGPAPPPSPRPAWPPRWRATPPPSPPSRLLCRPAGRALGARLRALRPRRCDERRDRGVLRPLAAGAARRARPLRRPGHRAPARPRHARRRRHALRPRDPVARPRARRLPAHHRGPREPRRGGRPSRRWSPATARSRPEPAAVRARMRRDLRYLEALEEGVREARAAGLTLRAGAGAAGGHRPLRLRGRLPAGRGAPRERAARWESTPPA